MTYTKNIFYYYFTRNQKKIFYVPIVRNVFLFILTVIITERFNSHFSRITWLEATRSFLLSCAPITLSMPLFFIADIGSKVSELIPSSIISKYFLNVRQGATKIDFSTFQFGTHSFQFKHSFLFKADLDLNLKCTTGFEYSDFQRTFTRALHNHD